MNSVSTADQTRERERDELRCASCGGVLMVFASDYVTWDRCIACGESEVLGWVSCQIGTLGNHQRFPAEWGSPR
jgi:hypothetical protein